MSELEETSIHNVALDPGFGGFKSAMIVDGTIRTATVPSVVGGGWTFSAWAKARSCGS